jgi:hypothetical protein
LPWQAKQSIPSTDVTFYGDGVKMCEDFAPNFGDQRTDCCIMTALHLTLAFSPGNFDQRQHDCHPPLTLLFSVSGVEDKPERLLF